MVFIGSDHAGFQLKEEIIKALQKSGYGLEDCGTDNGEVSVDYPDFAEKVAYQILNRGGTGIIICGTGIGISIAANKIPGIRAALCHDPFTAILAREHNDANILALGARIIGPAMAVATAEAFLKGEFASGRHADRLEKIAKIEKSLSRSENSGLY